MRNTFMFDLLNDSKSKKELVEKDVKTFLSLEGRTIKKVEVVRSKRSIDQLILSFEDKTITIYVWIVNGDGADETSLSVEAIGGENE